MGTDKELLLMDELQQTLEKQIKLARKGSIADIEVLAEQACILTGKVAESRVLELPEFKDYREKFQRLYKDLCLALVAKKAEVLGELNQVRKGKKTMETYRSSI